MAKKKTGGEGTVRIGKNSALIIVDVQNDFMPPDGALAVPEGDKIIPTINQYVEVFKGLPIFATMDWHPENHISFKERGGPWPPHCVQNTKGAELHPDLRIPANVQTIKKAFKEDEDAYSGFQGTDLEQRLKDAGVDALFVCGVATEYCVKNTVLDALRLGFKVFLLRDAIKGINEGDSERAIDEMVKAGATILELKDIETQERKEGLEQVTDEIKKKTERIRKTSERLIRDISDEIKKKTEKFSKKIKKIVERSKEDIGKALRKRKGDKELAATEFVTSAIRKVGGTASAKKKVRARRMQVKTVARATRTKRGDLPRGVARGKAKKEKGGGKAMATTKKGSAKPKQKAKCKKPAPKKKKE